MVKRYDFIDLTQQHLEKAKFVECPIGGDTVAVRTKICLEDGEGLPVTFLLGEIKPVYSSTAAVAGNSTSTILTYIVPPLKKLNLVNVFCSGENISKYTVKIDGATLGVKRSWWGNFNVEYKLSSIELASGSTVTIEVYNNSNSTADYDATLIGDLHD